MPPGQGKKKAGPSAESRFILGNVRDSIVTRLENIGRYAWAEKFAGTFSDAGITDTAADVDALEESTWSLYDSAPAYDKAACDAIWEQAQEDMWAGTYTDGLTEERVQTLDSDPGR